MTRKVILTEVSYGKTHNYLMFRGFVPMCDNSYLHSFEYCGTSLTTTASLPDDLVETFREMLGDDFDFPPFDLEKAKKILGEGREYYIEY